MKYFNTNYLVCIGSCLSQLIHTIATDCDNPNLSICGEAFIHRNKNLRSKLWYKLLNFIFFMQNDHCRWAYLNDLEYSQWYIDREDGKV
jgi:hypothetical protein